MKKIISSLLILLMLSGCTSTEETSTITYENSVELATFEVDMSSYQNMHYRDHEYLGISTQDAIKLLEEDGTGVLFLGYAGCGACNTAVPVLNEVAKDTGIKVNYVEADKINEADFNQFVEVYNDYLESSSNGEKTIFTPAVYIIVDGEVKAFQIGLPELSGGALTDAEHDEIYNLYLDMFKKLN